MDISRDGIERGTEIGTRTYMTKRQIPHINPNKSARRRQLLLRLAGNNIPNALIRRIQRIERVQIMHNRPQHERRTHSRELKVGLLLLEEVPRGLFGKSLAGSVGVGRVLEGLGLGDGVPVRFGVGVAGPGALEGVDDGGEGGGDDDALDGGRGGFDGFEDPCRADHGGVEEVAFGVRDVEVEGGGRVDHGFEGGCRDDGFVEGVGLRDVFDDAEGELV